MARGRPGETYGTVPATPERFLVRQRLLDALDGVTTRPLTLLTAPAGHGKTAAVAHWCRSRRPGPVTWLAAHEAHPDELAGLSPAPGAGARVVVVDGLDGERAAEQLEALVAVALADGADLHLVVTSRRPLADGVASLRLTGQADVIRTRDLQLRSDELEALVRLHTDEPVAPGVAAAVCRYLDGWMAGAVLVALDWDGRATPADHATVLDPGYRSARALLASSVMDLAGRDDEALLRRVACLPEVGGALCQHLLGSSDATAVLARLEAEGGFVRQGSAPGLQRWPHLVREALRDPARRGGPDEEALLRKASDWFVVHEQALLGAACLAELGDWDAVAGVLLANLHGLLLENRSRELADFITASMPTTVLQERFMWTMGLASMLITVGDVPEALALIATVEPGATPSQLVISNVLRVACMGPLEDLGPCLEAAERALALCDEVGEDCRYEDLYTTSRTSHWRAQARGGALILGAYRGEWARVAPHEADIDPMAAVEMPPSVVTITRGRRAYYFAAAGRLAEAAGEVERGLRLVPPDDRYTDVWVGTLFSQARAEVALGRYALDEAVERAAEAHRRSAERRAWNMVAAATAVEVEAHLEAGRFDRAAAALDGWKARGHRPPPVSGGRLAAAEARLLVTAGDVHAAVRLLTDAPPGAPVAATTVAIALGRRDLAAVQAVLDGWPDEPTVRSRVEAELARAALHEAAGHRAEAHRHLSRALAAAAPQGLVLPFVRLGVFVLRPLRKAAEATGSDAARLAREVVGALDGQASAVGRLTDRERLVLHHLAGGQTLPRLAGQLQVSVNTVKTQVQAIYRKLGVSSRADALAIWAADPGDHGGGVTPV